MVWSWGGKGTPIPDIKDFDLKKYGGVWYEQIRYPNGFQAADGKCVTAEYAAINETTVSVTNSQVTKDPSTNKFIKRFARGEAQQISVM